MPNKSSKQSGGINIQRSNVKVKGDMVGRDKIVSGNPSSPELAQLEQQFASIYHLIEQRANDLNLDKEELRDTVAKIEEEVKKGDEANPKKVGRWLLFLASMADDIFQVTVATLTHPLAGVAKAVQLIAQRAGQEES